MCIAKVYSGWMENTSLENLEDLYVSFLQHNAYTMVHFLQSLLYKCIDIFAKR